MENHRRLGRLYVFLLAAFLIIGGASADSAKPDVTDIWWNPAESGWGLQMVNTGAFVFATVYVYGANGNPTWLTGQLSKTDTAAMATFTGPLYVTTGPYYGSAFNLNAVSRRQAGTMTFVLTDFNAGQLSYSVDGVVVDKGVERLPLTLDDYSGTHDSIVSAFIAKCFDPSANNFGTESISVDVTHGASAMSQRWTFGSVTCVHNGTYSQAGRMGTFSSNWICDNGHSGTMEMGGMTKGPHGFMAEVVAANNYGCLAGGQFAGLRSQ